MSQDSAGMLAPSSTPAARGPGSAAALRRILPPAGEAQRRGPSARPRAAAGLLAIPDVRSAEGQSRAMTPIADTCRHAPGSFAGPSGRRLIEIPGQVIIDPFGCGHPVPQGRGRVEGFRRGPVQLPPPGGSQVGVQCRPVQRVGEARGALAYPPPSRNPSPATPPAPRPDRPPGRSARPPATAPPRPPRTMPPPFPGHLGSSASRARIIDASDRGTGSTPPGAASCEKESSASNVRTYNARPPLCSYSRPTARAGKARPATRAISPTSSLSGRPDDPQATRRIQARRSRPSGAAPGRLVTSSSTRSSAARRTTASSAWRYPDPPSASPRPPPPPDPRRPPHSQRDKVQPSGLRACPTLDTELPQHGERLIGRRLIRRGRNTTEAAGSPATTWLRALSFPNPDPPQPTPPGPPRPTPHQHRPRSRPLADPADKPRAASRQLPRPIAEPTSGGSRNPRGRGGLPGSATSSPDII